MPSQADPKAFWKLGALFGIISITIGVPYSICSNCPNIHKETSDLISNPLYLSLFSSTFGAIITLIVYKLFNESEHSLTRRLNRVKKTVSTDPQPTRVWLDGCFDLCHVGHFNAWRQAKSMGTQLIVGINPDKEVLFYKGPPLYTQEERYVMAKACKWVDEVVENVPYVMDEDYIVNNVLNPARFNCDIICHGDDPCLTPEGNDVFAVAKRLGKYREYNRTEGVSTTDYVGRMLALTKSHHNRPTILDDRNDEDDDDQQIDEADNQLRQVVQDADNAINKGTFQRLTSFMPTTRRLTQFATPKSKGPNQIVVYVDGAFDMFNPAHVDFIKAVKKYGDDHGEDYFVIVGVYTDNVANALHGENYPILNLQERVLSILSCKYVDDVVIGCPYKVSKEFIVNFNIKYVFHGTVNDTRPHLQAKIHDESKIDQNLNNFSDKNSSTNNSSNNSNLAIGPSLDPYEYVKKHNMLIQLQSPRDTTIKSLIQRVIAQKQAFEAKFEKKAKAEAQYTANKQHVEEL